MKVLVNLYNFNSKLWAKLSASHRRVVDIYFEPHVKAGSQENKFITLPVISGAI